MDLKELKNMDSTFGIGPRDKESHDIVMHWLLSNNYTIQGISNDGDHFTDITVHGDYNKCYNALNYLHISFENWD